MRMNVDLTKVCCFVGLNREQTREHWMHLVLSRCLQSGCRFVVLREGPVMVASLSPTVSPTKSMDLSRKIQVKTQ